MGKITGFLEIDRNDRGYRPVDERLKHFKEFVEPLPEAEVKKQASPLHGLRHSLLSQRLPGEQSDPGLE